MECKKAALRRLFEILRENYFFGFDDFKSAHIRPQNFWNEQRTIFLLIIVANANHNAGCRQSGTVQGVDKNILAVDLGFNPCAARLEIFKVAARADFQPFLLYGRIDFEVVTLAAPKPKSPLQRQRR